MVGTRGVAGCELCCVSRHAARDSAARRNPVDRGRLPAAFIIIGHGQNGFLTAALLGGALHLLDRRPWLAGLLIGGLAYKP
jgi:hypothetical protein